MREADLPVIGATECASYGFPWSEGIFSDCLGVGYRCEVIESGGMVIGYGEWPALSAKRIYSTSAFAKMSVAVTSPLC